MWKAIHNELGRTNDKICIQLICCIARMLLDIRFYASQLLRLCLLYIDYQCGAHGGGFHIARLVIVFLYCKYKINFMWLKGMLARFSVHSSSQPHLDCTFITNSFANSIGIRVQACAARWCVLSKRIVSIWSEWNQFVILVQLLLYRKAGQITRWHWIDSSMV